MGYLTYTLLIGPIEIIVPVRRMQEEEGLGSRKIPQCEKQIAGLFDTEAYL